MYLSGESIVVILLVGLVAGWLAGKIVQGTGFGLIGDIAIGIVGAFIASWLLPRLGIGLGVGRGASAPPKSNPPRRPPATSGSDLTIFRPSIWNRDHRNCGGCGQERNSKPFLNRRIM